MADTHNYSMSVNQPVIGSQPPGKEDLASEFAGVDRTIAERTLTTEEKAALARLLFQPGISLDQLIANGFHQKEVANYIKEILIARTLEEIKIEDFEEITQGPLTFSLGFWSSNEFKLELSEKLGDLLDNKFEEFTAAHKDIAEMLEDERFEQYLNQYSVFSAVGAGIEIIDCTARTVLMKCIPRTSAEFTMLFTGSYKPVIVPIAAQNSDVIRPDSLILLTDDLSYFGSKFPDFMKGEIKKFDSTEILNAVTELLTYHMDSVNDAAKNTFRKIIRQIKKLFERNDHSEIEKFIDTILGSLISGYYPKGYEYVDKNYWLTLVDLDSLYRKLTGESVLKMDIVESMSLFHEEYLTRTSEGLRVDLDRYMRETNLPSQSYQRLADVKPQSPTTRCPALTGRVPLDSLPELGEFAKMLGVRQGLNMINFSMFLYNKFIVHNFETIKAYREEDGSPKLIRQAE